MSTQSYVLGFAFDSFNRVALIKKERPDWQRGHWNGIGGKIKPNEPAIDAMRREFYEETGVDLPQNRWEVVGAIQDDGARIIVFTAQDQSVEYVCQKTDEFVSLFTVWGLPAGCISNVPGLVSLISNKPTAGGRKPKIVLLYGRDAAKLDSAVSDDGL